MSNMDLFLISFSVLIAIAGVVVYNIDFSKFKKKDLYEK